MKETKRGSSGTWHDIDIAEAFKHLPKVGEYAYYYDYDGDKDLATVHRSIVKGSYFSERSKYSNSSGTDHMFCIHIKVEDRFEDLSMYFEQMEYPVDSEVFANLEDLKDSIEWQNISNVHYAFDLENSLDKPLSFELEEEVKPTYFY